MKCHYEVLGVSSNASADDIKKSYRKLALEWHPDKNLHRTDEATETFQLIQQAYEILVDPQERAWYDRNKDKILLGDEDYVDDHLDVYQYFNTSRFKGYGDDEKSFYTIYREVFEKIAAEDMPFIEEEVTVPSFGYSYSSYKEEVYSFYAYWQSYCTAKPYTWVDKFDLFEARKSGAGRQVIRAMERENKKLREQHKKMRNEEVRQLVAFVRKRDKRVEDYKKEVEKQNAEKAKKAQEQRRKQIAERKKHLENYKESEWASMSALERHLVEIEANLDCEFGADSASEKGDEDPVPEVEDVSDLYCIACDKAFRSHKAMTNHQNSKKHKENVAFLRKVMQEEDTNGSYLDENLQDGDDLHNVLESNEDDICEHKQSISKKKKKKKQMKGKMTSEDIGMGLEDLIDDVNELQTLHELLVHGNLEEVHQTQKRDLSMEISNSSSHEDFKTERCPQQKYSKTASVILNGIMAKQDDHQNNSIGEENSYKSHENYEDHDGEAVLFIQQETMNSKEEIVVEGKKKSKSALRKAKKKAALEAEEQVQQVTTACAKCGKVLGSRNKLFEHLKKTGHSTFLSDKETIKSRKKERSLKN